MKTPRVLFILKYRHSYSDTTAAKHSPHTVLSSGLYNSANFVNEMLNGKGYESKIVHVVDNNSIDREVTQYKPDIVIIEALWVVPEKFDVLKRLHPNVKWIVRVHSEVPFLSGEGSAMAWTLGYLQRGVFMAPNSLETVKDFHRVVASFDPELCKYILYLPNYYPEIRVKQTPRTREDGVLHVGCFGALRPMKNQLQQAVAAIAYADKHNLSLCFHINGTRRDNESALPVLKNIRSLFEQVSSNGKHILVEHEWYDRPQFLELVAQMDICLQVSFTESFNIVAADCISQHIPVVVSSEIDWVPEWFHAEPADTQSIVHVMERAMWFKRWLGWTHWTQCSLNREVKKNASVWLKLLPNIME